MDKSTHEEHLSQPLLTKNDQFIMAITFLLGYSGIFHVKDKNNNFYLRKFSEDNGFSRITFPEDSYELES